MAVNKYLPVALLFFFFNTVGLPHGLTYMTLISPWLYVWFLLEKKQEPLWQFLLVLSPFAVMHIINGVDSITYVKSVLNLMAVYIFVRSFHLYSRKISDWDQLFYPILKINFVLCLIAIPLYFTPWHGIMWIEQHLTDGITAFRRLRLFTYEASYYAVLFTPVFFYCFLQMILKQNKLSAWILAPMLVLPYILSFSIGVLACLGLCIFLLFLLYAPTLLRRKSVVNFLIVSCCTITFVAALLVVFFPDNPLFVRIQNILSGHDSSGKGRTSEAFMLVKNMISLKSECWGIGFGQIKVLGEDIVRNYYHYDEHYAITIPNASAETLAVTGWIGWWIRLLVQLVLFFYTRVWRNYYRFLLFLFIFIYQFTGSYITSPIEYVIWIMAFTKIFPGFDVCRDAPNRASTQTL